jgi:hypothetical protein
MAESGKLLCQLARFSSLQGRSSRTGSFWQSLMAPSCSPGTCLFAPTSVLDKESAINGLADSWTIVYIGSFIGSYSWLSFWPISAAFSTPYALGKMSGDCSQRKMWPGPLDCISARHSLQLAYFDYKEAHFSQFSIRKYIVLY